MVYTTSADKIPRQQFSRNFVVAHVTRKSSTCCEEVWRVGRVNMICWRLSDHLDMSATSRVRVGLVDLSERHDKLTNGLHCRSRPPAANVTRKSPTSSRPRNVYEEVSDKLYGLATTKLRGNSSDGI